MAEEIVKVGWGIGDDNVKVSNLHLGGNFGVTRMTKFEYITNAGKEGAPMEALDINFNINATDKSYRIFPITKDSTLYSSEKGKSGVILEAGTKEWKIAANEAIMDIRNRVTHIMKCFVDVKQLDAALTVEIKTFKDYCGILMKLLPKDFLIKDLDIFLQWQWAISQKNEKTFLEIPTKLKYGKFLVVAEKPVGEWKAEINSDGLHYKDDEGTRHAFGRNAWFMDSHYATQQKEGSAEETMSAAVASPETATEVADSGETGW